MFLLSRTGFDFQSSFLHSLHIKLSNQFLNFFAFDNFRNDSQSRRTPTRQKSSSWLWQRTAPRTMCGELWLTEREGMNISSDELIYLHFPIPSPYPNLPTPSSVLHHTLSVQRCLYHFVHFPNQITFAILRQVLQPQKDNDRLTANSFKVINAISNLVR